MEICWEEMLGIFLPSNPQEKEMWEEAIIHEFRQWSIFISMYLCHPWIYGFPGILIKNKDILEIFFIIFANSKWNQTTMTWAWNLVWGRWKPVELFTGGRRQTQLQCPMASWVMDISHYHYTGKLLCQGTSGSYKNDRR